MKKIIIMRHAKSQFNYEGRIQGVENDSPLCDEGITCLKELIKREYKKIQDVDIIRCSNLKRAKETGEIIARYIHKGILLDKKLIEVNSGIIAGATHDECQKQFPLSYQVWKKRGDLDEIPYAEKGNTLQARVLACIYLSNDSRYEKELIITHAAFIRCFVNTCLNLPRENPVLIAHDVLYEFNNPWDMLDTYYFVDKEDKKVIYLNTYNNKYVLKYKKCKQEINVEKKIFYQTILSCLNEICSHVYYWCMEKNYLLTVEQYIEGTHKYGILKNTDEKVIFNLFNQIYDLLKYVDRADNTLKKKIEKIIGEKQDKEISLKGKFILNLLEEDNYENSIVYEDPHRKNIVFNKEKLYIIDCDSFITAPDIYQIASIICCTFLIEGYEMKDVERLVKYWPRKYDLWKIFSYIYVRAFIGYAYFVDRSGIDNEALKNKYLRILKNIEVEMEKSKK